MSVLKGEGKVPILFGSASIAVGSVTHGGYLSRPDLTGEWPTILVVPSAHGVTSNVKDICRRLARQGFAVVAADIFRGAAPSRSASAADVAAAWAALSPARVARDLGGIVAYVCNPAGFWSSAEAGFGVLGLGSGGSFAVTAAAASGAACVALVTTPLDDDTVVALGGFTGGVLGLFGRGDEVVGVDRVADYHEAAPHGEFVLYGDAGHELLDDYVDGYDVATAMDALDRLAVFYTKHLPPAPA